jgi:hypothetical protein
MPRRRLSPGRGIGPSWLFWIVDRFAVFSAPSAFMASRFDAFFPTMKRRSCQGLADAAIVPCPGGNGSDWKKGVDSQTPYCYPMNVDIRHSKIRKYYVQRDCPPLASNQALMPHNVIQAEKTA